MGLRIGRYEVEGQLGSGGAGVVYRARDPGGAAVAIKVLRELSPARLARFEREREAMLRLGPGAGFVPILDHGQSEQGPFLVLALCTGGDLEQRLRRGALPLDEALSLADALAAALARAHGAGLVHRDLKPANVLFDAGGRPLIADLGLSKLFLDAEAASPSRTGELRGSLGYLAPEQARDAKRAGPPADVFSWGALVHEVVTGQPAFDHPQPLERLEQAARGEFRPLRQLNPEAPRWLEAAVGRALDPDPSRRFADGVELSDALLAREAPSGRSPWLLALGALLLVALAGLAFALGGGRSNPTPSPTPSGEAVDSSAQETPELAPEVPAPLRRLRAAWPTAAGLVPLEIRGEESGAHGRPIAWAGELNPEEVATAGGGWVRIWDVETGALRRSLRYPSERPRASFESGLYDAEGGVLWLLEGRWLRRIPLTGSGTLYTQHLGPASLRLLQLSPDRKRALVRSNEWRHFELDLERGSTEPISLELASGVANSARYLPNGGLLVCDATGVWTRRRSGATRIGEPLPLRSGLTVDPRGQRALFVRSDGLLQVVSLVDGEPRRETRFAEPQRAQVVKSMVWSSGSLLVLLAPRFGGGASLFRLELGSGATQVPLEPAQNFWLTPGAASLYRVCSDHLERWTEGERRWPRLRLAGAHVFQRLVEGTPYATHRGRQGWAWEPEGPPRPLEVPRLRAHHAPSGQAIHSLERSGPSWIEASTREVRATASLPAGTLLGATTFLSPEVALISYTLPPPQVKSFLALWRLTKKPAQIEWPTEEWIRALHPLPNERVGVLTYTSIGVYSLRSQRWKLRPLGTQLQVHSLEEGGSRALVARVSGKGNVTARRLEVHDFETQEVIALADFPERPEVLGLRREFALAADPEQALLYSLADPSAPGLALPLGELGVSDVMARPEGGLYVATRAGLLVVLGPAPGR